MERLPLDGAARNLARNTVLAARQENQWTLRLSTGHQVLVNPERTQELAGALSDYFQRRIRLNLEYDAEAGATPPRPSTRSAGGCGWRKRAVPCWKTAPCRP